MAVSTAGNRPTGRRSSIGRSRGELATCPDPAATQPTLRSSGLLARGQSMSTLNAARAVAAARGAPAMVLAIAVLVLAVGLAVYWLRAPEAMGQRSMRPSSELPRAARWSATSWAVSTPRPAGASLVLMTRSRPDPDPISTAAESSRTVVS
jgi:hypothetical protein